MKKRFISALAALTCAFSYAAMPASANELEWYWEDVMLNDIHSIEFLSDYEFIKTIPSDKYFMDSIIFGELRNEKNYLIMEEWSPTLKITSEEITLEELVEITKNVSDDYNAENINDYFQIYFKKNQTDPMANARKISDVLKSKGISFSAVYERHFMYKKGFVRGMGILDYQYSPTYSKINIPEVLTEYIKENNIDATVDIKAANERYDKFIDSGDDTALSCLVVPNEPMTRQEQVELADRILIDTNIENKIAFPEPNSPVFYSAPIEMGCNIEGDANNDGTLTIADAAAILQHLGNKDKYKLTPQGKFNADFGGDGLTTADAAKIQKVVVY